MFIIHPSQFSISLVFGGLFGGELALAQIAFELMVQLWQ
jgi:hypothetical protein